ncbi:nuclear transport factor 2 family protein [Herbiconiux sp.]|uniref:nuclear transport factor 2 family protein n=1 Tax=Herbiconiux sp. TaxID=1871186 RepID=UPI0025BF5D1A|nr:nuclear transport factor 2 family protein [Herbiconiux sp.]
MSAQPFELPTAIDAFFSASNDEDRARFLAAFAADAVLDDWGRTFTGLDEIARWNESDNMGVHSRFEVGGLTVNRDIHVVAVHVTGEGYNGGGTIAFQLEGGPGGLISRVDITG